MERHEHSTPVEAGVGGGPSQASARDDKGDQVKYYVQVAYSLNEAEKAVTVLAFGSIPF